MASKPTPVPKETKETFVSIAFFVAQPTNNHKHGVVGQVQSYNIIQNEDKAQNTTVKVNLSVVGFYVFMSIYCTS